MTKGGTLKYFHQDDIQQQQKPFHVVLVDIEKAAENGIIHCVEKSLEGDTEDLSFVALSYRWGELEEQVIDTGVGYSASITSFGLSDFYNLCKMMMFEPDFVSIKYVWVDAICVDQTNHERRKDTIYHMSNIYERATYILAVPDLHRQYLQKVLPANTSRRHTLQDYQEHIYYLIHGNTEKLAQLENEFFDDIDVPRDQVSRQLAKDYSYDLMNEHNRGLENPRYFDDNEMIVAQPANASQTDSRTNYYHPYAAVSTGKNKMWMGHKGAPFEVLFPHSPSVELGPVWGSKKIKHKDPTMPWQNDIAERNNDIAHILQQLSELIKDWSSRVWVISESRIAAKRNNLKYWFTGLFSASLAGLPFFIFDFGGSALSDNMSQLGIHIEFHGNMINQLYPKSSFIMMLSSKASRNEDRFYAILPLTKYKDKLNQVGNWDISTMLSVKLKLFEIMDTNDKLILLFAAARSYSSYSSHQILPTFATSTISNFNVDIDRGYPLNFDLLNTSTITLHHPAHHSQLYYYLQLIPKGYSVLSSPYDVKLLRYANRQSKLLCGRFKLDDLGGINFVRLNLFDKNAQKDKDEENGDRCVMYLTGSFLENIWMLDFQHNLGSASNLWDEDYYSWDYCDNHDTHTIFNIY
ncbi:hypothetical protein BCR42DRAFT_184981 [Absidia repens]|uniref:Heterokaryon incompatibility domain-containing protein n=1 Tax=Absidia repens TaxID=90262 RepID=A0A1X2HXL5_9FUNG|nr:hypothetical protein BCR42DRAFT_184981 [Absidia repens]